MSGVLYIVATPIGNLSDITLRGIETLKKVDLIIAEDTRTSSVLLQKYEISTKIESYHKFNEVEKSNNLIEKISNGENIALISDAGTPLISDPGNILVKCAIENNIKIIPIGGISAVTTFISSIYRKDEDFKFIGFLPRIKSQIEEIIINNKFENLVFYESPNRIKDTFEIILEKRFDSTISIGRELTKKFEEIKTLKIQDMIEYYKNNPLKGEIVCMVHKSENNKENDILKEKVLALKNKGYSLKDVVSILEITDKVSKNSIKAIYLENN